MMKERTVHSPPYMPPKIIVGTAWPATNHFVDYGWECWHLRGGESNVYMGKCLLLVTHARGEKRALDACSSPALERGELVHSHINTSPYKEDSTPSRQSPCI